MNCLVENNLKPSQKAKKKQEEAQNTTTTTSLRQRWQRDSLAVKERETKIVFG